VHVPLDLFDSGRELHSLASFDEVDVNGNFFVADLIEPHDVHPRRIGLEPALAARFGDAIVGRSAFLGFEAYMNAAGAAVPLGLRTCTFI
jgi:hypothetical protein